MLCPLGVWKDATSGWTLMRQVLDSGANRSAIHPDDIAEYPVVASAGSKTGAAFTAADNKPIPNLGQRTLPVMDNDGKTAFQTHQVAEVCVPLNAVSERCDEGNMVFFTRHGGCILNETTGEMTFVPREQGIYVFEQWVPPYTPEVFHRRG